jgi:hypothetical protein
MNLRRACPATYTLALSPPEALRHLLGTASGVIEQDDRKIWWATAISSVAIAKQVGYEKFKGASKAPVPIDSLFHTNGDISRRVMTTLEALASREWMSTPSTRRFWI